MYDTPGATHSHPIQGYCGSNDACSLTDPTSCVCPAAFPNCLAASARCWVSLRPAWCNWPPALGLPPAVAAAPALLNAELSRPHVIGLWRCAALGTH